MVRPATSPNRATFPSPALSGIARLRLRNSNKTVYRDQMLCSLSNGAFAGGHLPFACIHIDAACGLLAQTVPGLVIIDPMRHSFWRLKMHRKLIVVPLAALLLGACVVAPAEHGYGTVIAPALPVYVELSTEPYYYQSGYHYYYNNSRWQYSNSRSGPWTDLPRDHYPKETRYKGRGDGRDDWRDDRRDDRRGDGRDDRRSDGQGNGRGGDRDDDRRDRR
jgi:hypothetical protein